MPEEQIKTEKSRFRKSEKLCKQSDIDGLFKENDSFIAYPLRVLYHVEKNDKDNDNSSSDLVYYPQLLISVPKRNFKRANKRNRLKRLIREAYRLNKQELVGFCFSEKKKMKIAFIYLKKETPTYIEVEAAVKKTFKIIFKQMKHEENID